MPAAPSASLTTDRPPPAVPSQTLPTAPGRLDGPVLTVTDKKGKALGRLGVKDLDAVLAAFARPGATAEERWRGAAVVRRVQQRDGWFRCGCLGPGEDPPVLVPVKEAYIRREASRPDHADGCPFESDAEDRARHARSLRAREPGDGFRLARAIKAAGSAPARDDADSGGEPGAEAGQGASRGPAKVYYRTKLSQLLFELLHAAGVHRVGPGPRGRETQVQALYAAARGISLGGELRLSSVLETNPDRLQDFIGGIRARARWPRGRRPHGVLVFVAARIEGEALVAASGASVAVEGPISVFGPGRGWVRRGPFVVAVLVASPDGHTPPVPLEAYAHPCWSNDDMLPVDSTHERRCLGILVGFQGWMAGQGCAVEIEKPLHDRSRYYTGREEADGVVKPDFEGTVRTATGVFLRSFVIEVKGFDHAEYRRAKARLERAVRDKRVHYVEHLAHGGVPEAEGDLRLRRDLVRLGRWAAAKAAAPPSPASVAPPPTRPDADRGHPHSLPPAAPTSTAASAWAAPAQAAAQPPAPETNDVQVTLRAALHEAFGPLRAATLRLSRALRRGR